MSWTLAKSLGVLRDQVNAAAPNRSKRSDGTIGDAAHSSRTSDHNPDQWGIVRAIDLTHDPVGGWNCREFAERLRLSRDPRIKYVIWNRRIFSSYTNSKRPEPWQWGAYTGSNPHDRHIHVSILPSLAASSDTSIWTAVGEPSGQPEEGDEPRFYRDARYANVFQVAGGPVWNVTGEYLDDVFGVGKWDATNGVNVTVSRHDAALQSILDQLGWTRANLTKV